MTRYPYVKKKYADQVKLYLFTTVVNMEYLEKFEAHIENKVKKTPKKKVKRSNAAQYRGRSTIKPKKKKFIKVENAASSDVTSYAYVTVTSEGVNICSTNYTKCCRFSYVESIIVAKI